MGYEYQVEKCTVMTVTYPAHESELPSTPLSEATVRGGNSIINARVPESAFERDDNPDAQQEGNR